MKTERQQKIIQTENSLKSLNDQAVIANGYDPRISRYKKRLADLKNSLPTEVFRNFSTKKSSLHSLLAPASH